MFLLWIGYIDKCKPVGDDGSTPAHDRYMSWNNYNAMSK